MHPNQLPAPHRNGGSIAPPPASLPTVNMETEAFIGAIGSRHVAVPRNHEAILAEIRTLATIGADAFYYEWQVDTKSGGKSTISGPTIKLANMLIGVYGNCGVDTKVTDTGDYWVFAATFVDAEKGSVLRRLFQQRKSQVSMKTKDAERQQDIAFQIGQSKAIRNVAVNYLSTYVDFALEHAKDGLRVKVERHPAKYREKIVSRLVELQIDNQRVVRQVGKGVNEWSPSDMAGIISSLQAITEGVATAEEIWPGEKKEVPAAPPPPGPSPSQTAPSNAKAPPAPAAEAPVPAPLDDAPSFVTPSSFKPWIIEKIAGVKTEEALDALWAKHEGQIEDQPEADRNEIIDAHENRRNAISENG